MKPFVAASLSLGIMLASCAGSQSQMPALRANAAPLSRDKSWMSPDAGGKNLLYVSSVGEVRVYDYGTDTEVGELEDFTQANGSCTDVDGNVYVTNYQAADVLEFAHGKPSPIKTLLDPSPYPTDCAVDATSGNVAVVNAYGLSEGKPGNVAIYAAGKGNPKVYKVKGLSPLISGSYDGSGDFIVSGYASSALAFAILQHGGAQFKSITLPHDFQWTGPSYVRWDGEYLDVEYQVPFGDYPSLFDWYSIHGTKGTQEGFMLTEGSTETGGPFWLGRIGGNKKLKRANQLVAGIADTGVLIWNYPEGGSYIFDLYNDEGALGVTVSTVR